MTKTAAKKLYDKTGNVPKFEIIVLLKSGSLVTFLFLFIAKWTKFTQPCTGIALGSRCNCRLCHL